MVWRTFVRIFGSHSLARRLLPTRAAFKIVNAVEKLSRSYEHIEPELVGNRRRVLISDLSGRSNIMMKAHELGIDLGKDTPEVREILQQLKQLEHEGYGFEAADASFHLLVQKLLKRHAQTVFRKLLAYRVIIMDFGTDSTLANTPSRPA